MAVVDVYRGGIKLGTGQMVSGAATVTSFARVGDRASPTVQRQVGRGRNITVVKILDGRTMRTRCIQDNVLTTPTILTLAHRFPFPT